MTRAKVDMGRKVGRLNEELIQPEVTLDLIGLMGVSLSQKTFRDQKFEDDHWEVRAVPNIFGILADFANGVAEPPERRFSATPVLRDSGDLMNRITHRVVSQEEVEWGSNLHYAAVHNFGGTVYSEQITPEIQVKLGDWLKTQSKQRQQQLGWLTSPRKTDEVLEGEVPERTFIGISDQLVDHVQRLTQRTLVEVHDGTR